MSLEQKYNELMQTFCLAAEALYQISRPEGAVDGVMCLECKTPLGETMRITVQIEGSDDDAE